MKFFKVIAEDERFLDTVSLLGEEDDITKDVADVLEELICKLHGANVVDINRARLIKITDMQEIA